MKEQSISEYFDINQKHLDNLFKKFQKLKCEDFSSANESFEKYKIDMQKYIALEEEVLFPLFERKTLLSKAGPTLAMKEEHKQILDLLKSIQEKIQKQDLINCNHEEEELLSILSNHNVRETSFFYPAVDKLVSDRERKNIFEIIRNMLEEQPVKISF